MLLAGCDKSEPSTLMAAARLDVSAVFLYAGSTLPGQLDGETVTIIDAFGRACPAGRISRQRLDDIERAICPGTTGLCIGHLAPEAASSGPIALVRDGDRVRLDMRSRTLDLLVDDAELAARGAAREPQPQNLNLGVAG